MPIMTFIVDFTSNHGLDAIFIIALEVAVAYYLVRICRFKLGSSNTSAEFYVAAAYLLNPLMILSNMARSASPLIHLTLVGALYHALIADQLVAMIYAALGTYFSIHPILILAPVLTILPTSVIDANLATDHV